MAKKLRPAKPERPRLVVYISPEENAAVSCDANSLGLKNGHAWARMKLAQPIRDTVKSFLKSKN